VLVEIGAEFLCNNFEFMFHIFGCQIYIDLAIWVLRYQLVFNIKIYVPGETHKRGGSAASLKYSTSIECYPLQRLANLLVATLPCPT
jgi:hypothetical protein